VHFLRRQPVEIVGDLLVGDLFRFLQRAANNQFR
jgi:hypothetical protein